MNANPAYFLSSQFLNFVLLVLSLCVSIAHACVFTATPAMWNSTLEHGSLLPNQALAVTPGTAGTFHRGWNDSKQKTPNKKTTLINSLSFPHSNQSMLPEQLCPDTEQLQLTPSMMFGCSRLCPRANPSFRNQPETLSTVHPQMSLYNRFLRQALLHPSFLSQGKALHSLAALVPTRHLHSRRQSSGTSDTLLKHAVTCC